MNCGIFFHNPSPHIMPMQTTLFGLLKRLPETWKCKTKNNKKLPNLWQNDARGTNCSTPNTMIKKPTHTEKQKHSIQRSLYRFIQFVFAVCALKSFWPHIFIFFGICLSTKSSDKIYTKQNKQKMMMAVWFLEVKGNHWSFDCIFSTAIGDSC